MELKIDVVRLVSQNSIIVSNLPDKLSLAPLSKKQEMEAKNTNSFGLFDTATPNFSNYYPDVKAEDLNPEADQASFIFPVFRALSEVIVHKRWNPIDFSKNSVLKNSMPLLKGQTVYPNHEMSVGNELGVIYDLEWQKSYKTQDGFTVPAGINSRLKIDGKSNPKIARGILMDPPSIHSTSVTVEYLWEKSHPKLTDDEFWSKYGTYGSDGELIRRMATEITRFHEISLVPHGADPFAQLNTGDGKIINPQYAAKSYNSAKPQPESRIYMFSYKDPIDTNTLSEKHNDPNSEKNMEYLLKLAQQMGIKTEGKDEAALQSEISNKATTLLGLDARVVTLTQEKANLETEKATLNQEKAALTQKATLSETVTKNLREAVKATLNALYDNKPDESLVLAVDQANYEALGALKTNFETQLEAKTPLCCQDCKSTNVGRRSSSPEEVKNKKEEKPAKPLSLSEAGNAIKVSKKPKLTFLS